MNKINADELIKEVSNRVEKELVNPTEVLLSIREQLKTGKDKNGEELVSITLDLDDETIESLTKYAKSHNSNLEEVAWLFIQSLIGDGKIMEV